MKKCSFHEDEIKFLSFLILAKSIKIEEKKNQGFKDKVLKNCPEPKSVKDIRNFLVLQIFTKILSKALVEL